MMLPADLTAAALAEIVGGELEGPGDVAIRGFEAVDRAKEGDLTFIADAEWASGWAESAASAALVSRKVALPATASPRAVIRVDDADAAMITILERFAPEPESPPIGIHPSAVVDPSASIDPTAAIGPQCCVGAGCRVGPRVILVAGVRLYRDAAIGEGTVLHASVTVR